MSKQVNLLGFTISVYVMFAILASYNQIQIKRITKYLRKELQEESDTFYYLTPVEQRRFRAFARITDFSAVGTCILFFYSWIEMSLGHVMNSLVSLFVLVFLFTATFARHQYITRFIANRRMFVFTDKQDRPLKLKLERKEALKLQHYHERLRNYNIAGFLCIVTIILMFWRIRGSI